MSCVKFRPVPSSALTRAPIDGPAGKIEVDIHDPGDGRRGIALIARPHPLCGKGFWLSILSALIGVHLRLRAFQILRRVQGNKCRWLI
ncbi:MAG: hypothetical protein HY525_13680 [Betaproteobacteria bacterium]|nr:hypothetical protein [Betaproteobacteria bacterium]